MQEFVNVNWDIFSVEEQEKMHALIVLGEPEKLALVVAEMNKEKENEIQKIRDQIAPLVPEERSTVITEFWQKHPDGPQSPAEEAELQALVDAETNKENENREEKVRLSTSVEQVEEPVVEVNKVLESSEEEKPKKKSKK